MPGQEDVFERGDTRNNDIHREYHHQRHRHFRAEFAVGQAGNGGDVGDVAGHAEAVGEDAVQIGQGTDNNVDTRHHDQKAQQGFKGALGHFSGGFFLQYQPQHGNKGDQDRSLTEQVLDDKVNQAIHGGLPSYRALSKRPQSFAQFPPYR
ncbi:hypothetical protein D3C75_872960 [compost metagenome]